MIYEADQQYDVPNVDLLTLIFGARPPPRPPRILMYQCNCSQQADHPGCKSSETTPLHIQAANPSICITKSQARAWTKRIAYTLRHRFGIGSTGPGSDAVVVISSGQSGLPMVFNGVIAAGGLYSAASSAYGVDELARQVAEGEAKVIVCSRDTKDVAVGAAAKCGVGLEKVLLLESEPEARLTCLVNGESCIGMGELEWERITERQVLEDRAICLLYSSGTTGIPKGVLLTHMNMVSECVLPAKMDDEYNHKPRAKRGDPPFEYRTIGHLPCSHIAGVQGYFINPIYNGGPVYWMPKFDFPKFLEYNKKYRITFFFSVPPIYLLIAKSPAVTDHFVTLERCVTGAAPMGKELQELVSKKLGKGNVIPAQTWGLSETTGSTTLMRWGVSDLTGSVSRPLPNVSVRIIDEQQRDMKPGESGEILVKGPMICKGYFKNPEASRNLFLDDFCRTGDVGFMKNGFLYVVDRMKELIKYKATQVAPAELEAVLTSHPQIADAAVIGVDGEGTELPRAYVVADQNVISAEQIKAFVKEKLASYKQLRGGVIFIPAIPKSPAGKILRKELRVLARRDQAPKL